MSLFTRDGEYVVCPFCGCQHGDALEWCTTEDLNRMACSSCGEEFLYWAEFDVQYVTKKPDPEAVAEMRAIMEQGR